MKIVKKFFVILFVFISIDGLCALKLEREADKGEWIKKTFSGKKIYNLGPQSKRGWTVMRDFVNQNNIEYIEPIAEGVDINDPNISKYNIACPNDKPINVSSIMVRYRVTREYEEEINICLKNMKIYNINRDSGIVDNKKYILYCENNRHFKDYITGTEFDNKNAVFLNFSTEKCEYSQENHYVNEVALQKESVFGFFRYHGKIYFYTVMTLPDGTVYAPYSLYSVMISGTGFVVGADIY